MPIAKGAQKKKKNIYIYISRYNTNICNLFTKKKTHFTGVGLKKKDPLSYRFNKLPRCTVPKVIDFLPYNMKCSGENVILCGIFHVVSCFPLHFMLYRENLDYFSDRVAVVVLAVAWSVYSRDGGAGGCYPPRRSSGRGCGQTWRT